MSTNTDPVVEDAERLVRYIIHHSPGNDVLPESKNKVLWSKLKYPRKKPPPPRPFYIILSVGNVAHRCDLAEERSFQFVIPRISTLLIDLYVVKKKGDVKVATARRELAPMVVPTDCSPVPVPLDVCSKKVVNNPSVELVVTLDPLTTHDATEMAPAPGQSSIAEDPRGTIIDESSSRVSTPEPLSESVGAELTAMRAHLPISDKWKELGSYARKVLGIATVVSELHPVAKIIFGVLNIGADEIEKRARYLEGMVGLIDDTKDVCKLVYESQDGLYTNKREEQVKACNVLVFVILRALAFVQATTAGRLVDQIRTKVNQQAEELRQEIRKLSIDVEVARDIDTQHSVFRMEDAVTRVEDALTGLNRMLAKESIANMLPGVNNMQPGSKDCMPGTRVGLLQAINEWLFGIDSTRCHLLTGMAGEGKSAVAHAVALRLKKTAIPVLFFAFDRNDRTRKAHQMIPTLALQLSRIYDTHLQHLRTLAEDELMSRNIATQYDSLLAPFLRTHMSLVPIVFVIDALDECPDTDEEAEDRNTLLQTLQTVLNDNVLHNVRFFITTRPEKDICGSLGLKEEVTVRRIGDCEGTREDIHKFVLHKLSAADKSNYVDRVVDASEALFECARILCREIAGSSRPNAVRLFQDIECSLKRSPGESMSTTYHAVLKHHFDTKHNKLMELFRTILAWVFSVRRPQPQSFFRDIARVLGYTNSDHDVDAILAGLTSLLTGTAAGGEEPIRPLHTSFRDFVLDAKASGVFAITSEFDAANSQLALACFGIMGRPAIGLRYNICDLPSPFVYKEDVENLDGRLTKHVSSALHYACREISAHLSRCENRNEGLVSALRGFLLDSFLYWVEVCGWLGYEPCDVLQETLEWAKKHDSDNSATLVSDFISFAKRYREAISTSPPQVYITGLHFAPVYSCFSQLYRLCITSPIKISGIEQERVWPLDETVVIQAGSCVHSIAYSPDGTKIVAGLDDYTLRVWDAGTGRQVGGAMRGHEDAVLSVAFSPDVSRIASGSRDRTIRLWDAKTGQQQGTALRGHTDHVRSVAFSPDGVTVVSGSGDHTLRLWDVKAGKELGEAMEGHTGEVVSVVSPHNGTQIFSGGDSRSIRIWEAETRRQLGNPILHADWVTSIATSRDGKYIAFGFVDWTVRLWDAQRRQQLWTAQGHVGRVYAVAFSPDRTRIVSGGNDSTVRVWDAVSGKQVGHLRGHTDDVNTVAFSPDRMHVASGSGDGTIRVYGAQEVKKDCGRPVGHTGAVFSVVSSSDGKYIASGSRDKTVRLWDASTGQPVGDPMTGHDGIVNCVTFSPDSTRIASASDDGTVRVWDATTRLLLGDVLREHDSPVLCVAFSPDGTRLVSGSQDYTLRLWDLATGQQLGDALWDHKSWVYSVSFSSDGLTIASGSEDSTIRLRNGQLQLRTLEGHQSGVRSVAFSLDGEFLVSGSNDRTIRLWDAHTGKQMGEPLTGHTDCVRSVSFSPDGRHIVSGSDDLTVRVWDAQTGQQVGIALRGHEDWVSSVAFSSDGTRAVSGSVEGTIRVWDSGRLQSSQNPIGAASANTTRAHVQASLREDGGGWLVYDDNGTERPILWIPHHLRHIHRVHSPFHVQFVPPTTPQIHITLNDSFPEDLSEALVPGD